MSAEPGRVVVLNGTSSAGKTTLANEFVAARRARGECWIVLGIDDFNSLLPGEWWGVPTWTGPFRADGVRFVPGEAGLLVEVGEIGRQLYATYRRAVGVFARHGFDVVVDEVTFDEEAARDWDEALSGLAVVWVAVHCDPDIAEARERDRGDRALGLARGLAAVVHAHHAYDLELDAGAGDPSELAGRLDSFLT